ncbi:unnamed protein product [Enterobius vermicularis]|uniref:Sushi domain-containing protein n=1 Tax=Enterobius vermicularis TaxID=51028 RepID=A0A3P6IPV8_ENTVE|nr:unnamed protein product [Enterobius vermicularis]
MFNISSTNAQRFGRPKHCKKPCNQKFDCTSENRECLKDGDDCGKSCVNRFATCPALKDPAHGWVLLVDTVFNSSAEYGCYKGYELIGKSQRRCRGDRQWSEAEPICRPIAKCDSIPEIFYGINNGSNLQKLYDLNTIVYYQCIKGYYPEDEHMSVPIAKCSLSRTGRARWHGPKLVCKARSCLEAPQIANSTRYGDKFEYPNEVTYVCNPGFRMYYEGRKVIDDRMTARCLENGSWDKGFPSCYPINCSYPHNPINGEVRGNSVSFMSEIHYSCKRGFRLVGQYSRKCKEDGTWTGSEPTCSASSTLYKNPYVLEILCPPLKTLFNGEIENNSNKAGSTVYFRCWEATSLEGLDSATCKLTGEWSNTMPTCLAHCRIPYIINGRIIEYEVNRMVRNGTKVTLSCQAGYESKGDIKLECNNGTWLQPALCKPADCDWPPKVKNALAIFVKSRHGSYARYECNAGFRPSNDNKMQCRFGVWRWAQIGDKFRCNPVFCSNPRHSYGTLKGGQILLEGQVGSYTFPDDNNTEHGRSITFQCYKGYILIGPPRGILNSGTFGRLLYTMLCKATCINGTWMPKYKPECIQKKYPTMEGQIRWARDKRSFGCQPIRSDYRKIISYFTVNGTFIAKVTCLEGYQFTSGSSSMQINCVGGRWERSFPECIVVDKCRSNDHFILNTLIADRCRIPLKKHGFFILVDSRKFLQSGEMVENGSKVKLICDLNSKVNGYDTVECRRGKFLKRAGKCRPSKFLFIRA